MPDSFSRRRYQLREDGEWPSGPGCAPGRVEREADGKGRWKTLPVISSSLYRRIRLWRRIRKSEKTANAAVSSSFERRQTTRRQRGATSSSEAGAQSTLSPKGCGPTDCALFFDQENRAPLLMRQRSAQRSPMERAVLSNRSIVEWQSHFRTVACGFRACETAALS